MFDLKLDLAEGATWGWFEANGHRLTWHSSSFAAGRTMYCHSVWIDRPVSDPPSRTGAGSTG